MVYASEPQARSRVQVMGKAFGIRAGAYIIDAIVFGFVYLAVGFLVTIVVGVALALSGREFNLANQQNQCVIWIVEAVLFTLYFAVFEWLYGATLGKLVLGLRVVKENCERCDLGAAVVRGLLRYTDGILFGLPALTIMREPLFQRFGDKTAKTIVVDAKEAGFTAALAAKEAGLEPLIVESTDKLGSMRPGLNKYS